MRTKATIYAAMLAASLAPWPAHAGGFLADTFIRPFSPHAADEADKVHRQLGNPLDHAANAAVGAAVNTVAPGAGPVVTTVLENRPH